MDFIVRFMTRAVMAAVVAAVIARPVEAQSQVADPPPNPDFLTRADFHLGATMLGSGDERFAWDTHWGGEVDFVDYVKGRVTFYGDYQAVLGHELQPFDPNQGNYTLTVSSSLRLASGEVALVFNHVSRHLGDRPKTFGIAMNVLGLRWLDEFAIGAATVDIRADGGSVIQNAYVDYTWIAGGDVRTTFQFHKRADAYFRLNGEIIGVDPAIAGRSRQEGGGAEVGVRLKGAGGVLELFGGVARVVDADPIDRETHQWALVGFRILSQ